METATIEQSGDLAELVRLHQAGIWRYLRFLGCDEARADDLTQETFLAVHRRPFHQRGEAATAAYLRTVARHQYLMALRHDRRRPALTGLIEAGGLIEENGHAAGHGIGNHGTGDPGIRNHGNGNNGAERNGDGGDHATDAASMVEDNLDLADEVWTSFTRDDGGQGWLDALRTCVETLNGRAQQAIDLHYREDQSRAAIASTLGMTEDGVKSLLRRTRDLLRKCIESKMT
jgi:RNA polymerase sigma-70 factor (ECF subfamily)